MYIWSSSWWKRTKTEANRHSRDHEDAVKPFNINFGDKPISTRPLDALHDNEEFPVYWFSTQWQPKVFCYVSAGHKTQNVHVVQADPRKNRDRWREAFCRGSCSDQYFDSFQSAPQNRIKYHNQSQPAVNK